MELRVLGVKALGFEALKLQGVKELALTKTDRVWSREVWDGGL